MGYYINQTSNRSLGASFTDKCEGLLQDGALEIKEPKSFIPNIVCVVDNGYFAAAAHAYSEEEMNVFKAPDSRPRRWFIWDKVNEYAG